MKNKVFCVLGMHRSGTSCLTGTLEEAGVFLGDVSRKNPHNVKGNCENSKIMALHEDLFSTNGGSWDSPPSQVVWSENHKMIRDEIIKDYKGSSSWGFKDPRTLFTLEGWVAAIPQISMVGIFRDPVLVAYSLHLRNGFSLERGITLWAEYNEKLLSRYYQRPFPIISFDEVEQVFKSKLLKLLDELGLPASIEKFNFFDSRLRRSQSLDVKMPKQVLEIYETLQREAI